MIRLAVLVVLLVGATNAQDYEDDDYEICIGLPDGEMIGVGPDISCTEYFYCDKEIGLKSDCGDGFEFDYIKNECGYDDEVQCNVGGGDPEPDPEYPEYPDTDDPEPVPEPTRLTRAPELTDTTIGQTTPSDPSVPDVECPTNRPGEIIFFPSSDCSEYFICANGFRMKMMCMEGFTWNQEEKQCDYPIFSRCSVSFKTYL